MAPAVESHGWKADDPAFIYLLWSRRWNSLSSSDEPLRARADVTFQGWNGNPEHHWGRKTVDYRQEFSQFEAGEETGGLGWVSPRGEEDSHLPGGQMDILALNKGPLAWEAAGQWLKHLIACQSAADTVCCREEVRYQLSFMGHKEICGVINMVCEYFVR